MVLGFTAQAGKVQAQDVLAAIELKRAIERQGREIPARIEVELHLSDELATRLNITVDVEKDPKRLKEHLKPLDECIEGFVLTSV